MNIQTHITYCAVITLLSQSFFSQQVQAQQDDSAALIAIIDAVEKGWNRETGSRFASIFWISRVLATSSRAGKTLV